MSKKAEKVCARVDPEVKKQAEAILAMLGIPASTAITMFYKQIILRRALPFNDPRSLEKPLEMNELSAEELDQAIGKGASDFKEGRSKTLAEAVIEVRAALKK